MGKGSKRRTGEDTGKIVSNWDKITWGDNKKIDKEKNERERINDNVYRRD